jgi:hypothetical protein
VYKMLAPAADSHFSPTDFFFRLSYQTSSFLALQLLKSMPFSATFLFED